jgi:ribulose-phosphate 3-epimerase
VASCTKQQVLVLKELILKKNASTLIEIDGGVKTSNAAALVERGADVLVAGSSVFKSSDPMQAIHDLKNLKA